jgi:hypothetical protein
LRDASRRALRRLCGVTRRIEDAIIALPRNVQKISCVYSGPAGFSGNFSRRHCLHKPPPASIVGFHPVCTLFALLGPALSAGRCPVLGGNRKRHCGVPEAHF